MLLVAVILWGLAVGVSACHKSYCMLHLYNQCILIQETVMLSKKNNAYFTPKSYKSSISFPVFGLFTLQYSYMRVLNFDSECLMCSCEAFSDSICGN